MFGDFASVSRLATALCCGAALPALQLRTHLYQRSFVHSAPSVWPGQHDSKKPWPSNVDTV